MKSPVVYPLQHRVAACLINFKGFNNLSQGLCMYDLILSNVVKHIQLTDEEIKYFTSLLRLRKIRKRQYLLQAGVLNPFENFVKKSCLRAYTVDSQGEEHIVMFGLEGWWISDLYSFLTNTPAAQNVDALEDSEVFSIEKSDLDKLYEQVPKFNKFFLKLLQNATGVCSADLGDADAAVLIQKPRSHKTKRTHAQYPAVRR